ncbi:MAG: hypothetical protein ACO3RV_05865, partial [Luteolibacter sp.]
LQDYVSNLPLGRTAYLGYEVPASSLTQVYRSIEHDPVASGIPVVSIDSYLGIQDSTKFDPFNQLIRDRFLFSIYNLNGDFLAAICFATNTARVLRDDGVQRTHTGIDFIRGNQLLEFVALQLLEIRIDLARNEWSAWLDGVPIFENITFTATGVPLSLGLLAYEWEIVDDYGLLGFEAGDNWMFVADLNVRSVPVPREPFAISSLTRQPDGSRVLTWPAQAGFDYRVHVSNDLNQWQDLPDGVFPNVSADSSLTFTDDSPAPLRRFYRISRNPSP